MGSITLLTLAVVAPAILPGHFGRLHPYEHALVYLLAFGPLVLLALTVWASRRRAGREPGREQDAERDRDVTRQG